MRQIFIALTLPLALSACGIFKDFYRFDYDPNVNYRMETHLEVTALDKKGEETDKKWVGEGIVLVDRAPGYKIKGKVKARNIDYLIFRTRGREEKSTPQNDDFEVRYMPNDPEANSPRLSFKGFEKERSRGSMGQVYIRRPEHQVPITVNCNGKKEAVIGTYVCHSPEGYPVWVELPEEAIPTTKGNACPFGSADKKLWKALAPKDDCKTNFIISQQSASVIIVPFSASVVTGEEE